MDKLDQEIQTLKEANAILESSRDLFTVLDKVQTWMMSGRLTLRSIDANQLQEYVMLLNEIQSALVRARRK